MKFVQYINENSNIASLEEIVEILTDKCGPFLNDTVKKGTRMPFIYSGRKDDRDWFIKPVRKNRRPKDTPLEIHNILDDEFNKRFGFRARSNVLFAVSDDDAASGYGNVYLIFPIGRFKYLYNPDIDDLWISIKAFFKKYNIDAKSDQNYEMKEILDEWIYLYMQGYTTKNLHAAINASVEIMVHCDEYVAVNAMRTWRNLLAIYFKDFGNRKFDRTEVEKWALRNKQWMSRKVRLFKDDK